MKSLKAWWQARARQRELEWFCRLKLIRLYDRLRAKTKAGKQFKFSVRISDKLPASPTELEQVMDDLGRPATISHSRGYLLVTAEA